MHACQCSWDPEEGFGSLEVGLTAVCEPLDMGTGAEMQLMVFKGEEQVL